MTELESLKLAPCPFCGGEAHFERDFDMWVWIVCGGCGVSTNQQVSLMDDCRPLLAERWNQRKEQSPLTDEEVWNDDELMKLNAVMMLPMEYFMRVVRAIEAKIKEKNT